MAADKYDAWVLDVFGVDPESYVIGRVAPATATAKMSPTAGSDAQQSTAEDAEEEAYKQILIAREGKENIVYKDSVGKPTVGIGHLVRPSDNLKVGDTITDAQVDAFFKIDSQEALAAAREQAAEASITSTDFVPYLASVNFQMGTGWTGVFKGTWKSIIDGEYETAAASLDGTLWSKQTATRVKDFQDAIRRLPPKAK